MTPSCRSGRALLPAALLVGALLLVLSAGLAAAHTTTLVSSDPGDGAILARSPALVKAVFADELVSNRSTMTVIDAGGKQVSKDVGRLDLTDPGHVILLADLPAPLADGAYTVTWHALLTDGDATDGTFAFTIRAGAAPELATPPPTRQPTPTATPAPTALPLPTVAAGPAAAAPSDLPATGTTGYTLLSWLAALTFIAVAGLGLAVTFRRNPR